MNYYSIASIRSILFEELRSTARKRSRSANGRTIAVFPQRRLRLTFRVELRANLEVWRCVPKEYDHLVPIRLEPRLGDWRAASRKFIGRIVTHFLFCPQKSRGPCSLERAVWAALCTGTGNLLSGVMVSTGPEYRKFKTIIDEECSKQDQLPNRPSRMGNCNRRVTYVFTARSDSRLVCENVSPMHCDGKFDEYRKEYIVNHALILDNRPPEMSHIVSSIRSKKKRKADSTNESFIDMAPNLDHQCIRPTLTTSNGVQFRFYSNNATTTTTTSTNSTINEAKRFKMASEDSKIAATITITTTEPIGCVSSSVKNDDDDPKAKSPARSGVVPRTGCPITTDAEYYWAIVTKWRGFDHGSIHLRSIDYAGDDLVGFESDSTASSTSGTNERKITYEYEFLETTDAEERVPGLHLNLPKLKTIPDIKTLTTEQAAFTSYVRKILSTGGGPKRLHVLSLTGPAGSGKTKCLDVLQDYNTLYVACKGQLVQDINQSCRVSMAVTWAKFGITLMGLSFFQWMNIAEAASNITPASRRNIFRTQQFYNLPSGPLAHLITKEFQIIYIDEFSMISYGEITLLLELLTLFKSRLIVVLVGDPAQMPPIRSHLGIENASLILKDWVEREFRLHIPMRFTEKSHADNMDKLRKIVLQKESPASVHEFVERHFVDRIALCPRFNVTIYYPSEPCPPLQFIERSKNESILVKCKTLSTLKEEQGWGEEEKTILLLST
ncbi:unnamed protein product [Euphydryas editha]|uniref:Uncharacterized protein n=1 Tax=Euphydryas editha TaxID=104508 RepID=A0AAU9VFG6_EUPED|nr:unnamed protein product [Euphydryas editha]